MFQEREMESSVGFGYMAVFAASGSIALLVHQVHKRLLSDFMKKVEFELGGIFYSPRHRKNRSEKKVRFADDVREPSSNNKEYRKKGRLKAWRK